MLCNCICLKRVLAVIAGARQSGERWTVTTGKVRSWGAMQSTVFGAGVLERSHEAGGGGRRFTREAARLPEPCREGSVA